MARSAPDLQTSWTLIGIFRRSPASGRVWIVIPDDRYIEMLIGFTKKEEAFAEMLAYSVVAGENK